MKKAFLVGMVSCLWMATGNAFGVRAPYSQLGWVTIDQWGGTYLCYKSAVVPVAQELHKEFRAHRDKFVECSVKKVHHSWVRPGPWRIDSAGGIEDRQSLDSHVHPVRLRANVSKKTNVSEVIFQLIVAYDGTAKKRVQIDDVRLVILKKKGEAPPEGKILSHEITNGPSYVYLNQKLSYRTLRGSADSMRVTSEHPFDWFIVFREKLLPGEYAAWLMYHDPSLADEIGTRSNTIEFSVTSSREEWEQQGRQTPNQSFKRTR